MRTARTSQSFRRRFRWLFADHSDVIIHHH